MTTRDGTLAARAPDGRRVAFDVHGPDDGPTVLYLHGVPSSRLETQVFGLPDAAADAGVRLVALDRPGIGGSDPHPGRTLHDTATDVAAVADALRSDRFAVVGYSAGAPSAIAAAARLGDRVTALAIVSGIAPGDRPDLAVGRSDEVARMFRLARDHPRQLRVMLRIMRLATRRPAMLVAAAGKGAPPADLEVLAQPGAADAFAAFLVAAFAQGLDGVATDFHLAAGAWDVDLRSLAVRTHVWHGARDRNAPIAAARWLHEQLPTSELEVGPEDGHASLISTRGAEILTRLART